MEVLTGRFPALLTPTSQEGGNMIQPTLAGSAMTAPGSTPVTPLPGPLEGSDPAIDYSGPQIPVSHPGQRDRVAAAPARWGGATFDVISIGGAFGEV
jgi:hypothetical protein